MKTLIISLLLSFVSIMASAQTTFKAVSTEMYIYNSEAEEWSLYEKHSNVDITILLEKEILTFYALTLTIYRLYPDSREPIKSGSIVGYRYSAKELKQDKMVYVDIVKNSTSSFISVINTIDGYNLRYYLK